jgi:23S rRNA pseudouridine955/2504/2580 synthase
MTINDLANSTVSGRTKVRQETVAEDLAGMRLDRALGTWLPGIPRTRLFRLIRKGEVRVNGKRAQGELRLAAGDMVRIPPVRVEAEPVAGAEAEARSGATTASARRHGPSASLRALVQGAILHEDERLLVLDKPAGVAVHGGSGLDFGIIEVLRALRPDETLELVHRLDRDTSGCLLVARKPAALRTLHALMRDGEVQKSYLVLVAGRWELGRKRIDVPLLTHTRVGGERTVRVGAGGKEAVTDFALVEQIAGRASLLEVDLHTGRTHQIRVHAAHCGHPVAGDEKYGDAAFNAAMRELGLKRMFLHSHRCGFSWPGGAEVSYSAPLPPELKQVLDALHAARKARGRQGSR